MTEFFAWVLGIVAAVLPGFGQPATPIWNGYVEADYAYIAAASPGPIATIAVANGDEVAAGQVLFTLSNAQQQALLSGAEARAGAAEANLDNLLTGSRREEVDVIRASLAKAQADFSLAQQIAARSEQLFEQGLTPQAKLDQDRASLASAHAQVSQLQAQLKVAELPARGAQQIAAEANLSAAKADVAKAKADLADRTIMAPADGRVEQVFFKAGEMAGAGVPVVSLLDSGALKIKFYVNEDERDLFAIGDRLSVSCDGCPDGIVARISHFASDPQFTPPIIYSRDERSRLVFLTEATLEDDAAIRPGQPVTVGQIR